MEIRAEFEFLSQTVIKEWEKEHVTISGIYLVEENEEWTILWRRVQQEGSEWHETLEMVRKFLREKVDEDFGY